jgi:hypothetical protein
MVGGSNRPIVNFPFSNLELLDRYPFCSGVIYVFSCFRVSVSTRLHVYQSTFWFSGIFRDAPPNVGRIANPTYAAPPDMLVYHGNSQ